MCGKDCLVTADIMALAAPIKAALTFRRHIAASGPRQCIPRRPSPTHAFSIQANTLYERTLAINALYPNAPLSDSELWLSTEGSYGARRRSSTSWPSTCARTGST
jgi:hypothetical protein